MVTPRIPANQVDTIAASLLLRYRAIVRNLRRAVTRHRLVRLNYETGKLETVLLAYVLYRMLLQGQKFFASIYNGFGVIPL
jgi:hypothetical protein